MPKHSRTAADQGIERDERTQEQPRDKKLAQQMSRAGEKRSLARIALN
jgi:hypothetical protein